MTTRVMEGGRVLEAAQLTFVRAAGAIPADRGAGIPPEERDGPLGHGIAAGRWCRPSRQGRQAAARARPGSAQSR